MPNRKVYLAEGQYYHVFNRGVAKMPIFHTAHDYRRFLNTMQYYQLASSKPRFSQFKVTNPTLKNTEKLVSLCSYVFMPNHFHFLMQQLVPNGISQFMSQLSNSYTKYINTKYKRVGPLFQGNFKAVHVESNEQLIHLTRYIHLNPLIGYVTNDLNKYKWSSYAEYIDKIPLNVCSKKIVLDQFISKEAYKIFVEDHIDYAQKLDHIKHLCLDAE